MVLIRLNENLRESPGVRVGPISRDQSINNRGRSLTRVRRKRSTQGTDLKEETNEEEGWKSGCLYQTYGQWWV